MNTLELRQELALANRILYRQGIVDGYGHVSVRHPSVPDSFLLARAMPPGAVQAEDIVHLDFAGENIGTDLRKSYLERFIHSEIFRARPDVMAVVHSHSRSVIPFGVVQGARLRPVFHSAAFVGEGAPVFEIRPHRTTSCDLLISSPELGRALADSLGNAPLVLMRGHGSTTVGMHLRQAVFRAIYAEENAKVQLQAQGLGEITFLSDEEVVGMASINDRTIDRCWAIWAQAL